MPAALITLSLLLASPVFAIERQFGLIGGLNIAGVWGNEAGDTGFRNGAMAGLVMTRKMSDNVRFRSEITYTQKGTEADIFTGSTVETVRGELEYIEIPLLLDISFTNADGGAPYVFMGPAVAYNLSARIQSNGSTVDVSNINKTDIGFLGGFGLGFGSEKRAFFIEMRYELGLTQLFSDVTAAEAANALNNGELPVAWPDNGQGVQFNNAVLTFNAGFMF